MTHLDPDRDLLPYALGELDALARERVAAHLAACARCTREADALRSLVEALPRAFAPPQATMAAARARLDRSLAPLRVVERAPFRQRLWLASAAAVILLLVLRPHVDLTPTALPARLGDLDQHALSRFILDRLPRPPLVKERTGA